MGKTFRHASPELSSISRIGGARRRLRRRLALTTILTLAPFASYGRPAFAACEPSPASPTFVCRGVSNAQTITASGADVSTAPGFSVPAGIGDAIAITGDGHLRFTDDNASQIRGSGNGLSVVSTDPATPSAITITANGHVTGDLNGIRARNEGRGDLTIEARGDVEGLGLDGIAAANSVTSTNLKITTGAASTVLGGGDGIEARNFGTGDLEIIANGDVLGNGGAGISAANPYIQGTARGYGNDLTVTTGSGTTVRGEFRGIDARNGGDGNLEITVQGTVRGVNDAGIGAYNSALSESLTITTQAGSAVKGSLEGINASNFGTGDFRIIAKGDVEGQSSYGIVAYNSVSSGGLAINAGSGSAVTGYFSGINAVHRGKGDLEITVDGIVTGTNANGIQAVNIGSGTANIEIGAAGRVEGSYAAIMIPFGSDVAITNHGVVRNLSSSSSDLAISAGAAASIDNSGSLIGKVVLSEASDRLDNGGLWDSARGSSDFGGGDDTVNNAGTLRGANSAAANELTLLTNLEHFNNSGVVSLADGREGDRLEIGGQVDYVGNGGSLAVDAVLAPGGTADMLIINGKTSGVTYLEVRPSNPQTVTPNFDGITMVVVNGTTADGNFDAAGGVRNTGFFAWDMRRDGNTHELYTTGLGAGAYEFAAGVTGAQDMWLQTTGALVQRQADLRSLLEGTSVTPAADYAEPVEPVPLAKVTPGFWFRGVGAFIKRDDDEDDVTLDRKQTVWGGLAGFDFGTQNVGDALMFGLFGGYLTSDLDFDQTSTKWTYEGPTVGAYASYLDRAFYVEATVKADFLDIDIDADDIAPSAGDADTDAVNIGGQIDAGYKLPLSGGLFAEPQASLVVLHTEIDDIDDIFGGAVTFDDATSVRGRLGLRLGHEHTASDGIVYSGDVTASVWENLSGDNDATIFAPVTPATVVSDDPGETFGDLALGFNVLGPDGWSGFVRGNWTFNADIDAITGNAGVRYAW